jgi:acyl-coenzyme A thioesterase PaaI-like protein
MAGRLPSMKAGTFRRLMNLWPPFLFTGIAVRRISDDFRDLDATLTLRFYNRNTHGSHFGGSLFAMTDPFYALMLAQILGPDYVIWDKAASIDFRLPAKGVVSAHFHLDEARIEAIRRETADGEKHFPKFAVEILDQSGAIVASVHKTLYVRRRRN